MPSASTLCKLSRSRHRCTLIFLPKFENFSTITDQELDCQTSKITAEFPHCGEGIIKQILLGKNIKVQRWRLPESLHRVDAEGIAQRRKGRLFHFTYTELVHPPINCAFRNGKKF